MVVSQPSRLSVEGEEFVGVVGISCAASDEDGCTEEGLVSEDAGLTTGSISQETGTGTVRRESGNDDSELRASPSVCKAGS